METYLWTLLGPLLIAVPVHALVKNFFVALGIIGLAWPVLFFGWIAFAMDQHINLGFLPIGGTMAAAMAMPSAVLVGLLFHWLRRQRTTNRSPQS